MPVQVVVSRPIELQSVSIRNLGEALASLSRVARLLVPVRLLGPDTSWYPLVLMFLDLISIATCGPNEAVGTSAM